MDRQIQINSRLLGKGKSTYIIAEMSANQKQDFNQAVKNIEAAAKKLPENSIFAGF